MKSLIALLLIAVAPLALAADHLVSLKKRAFIPETLNIRVGDTVTFRNDDAGEHNISSQSAAKTFEIESLDPGENRKISFDKAGKIEIGCGLHEGMQFTIQVAN